MTSEYECRIQIHKTHCHIGGDGDDASLAAGLLIKTTVPSQELDRIATSVCEHPDSALASLEAIDYKSLSESDRHYHDFLTIKARDKGYVEHTSDSLILDVIDYYSSNDDRNLYPEVLYYGGRVYSDLGDYPTSLSYFQKALDNLPENYPDRSLESRLSSQTGRLLIGMRLYGEAIPYMERAIKANHATRDTVNLIYNYGLIGSAYIYLKDYDNAELNLKNAADWAQFTDNRLLENIRIDMAAVKLHKNRLDSALAIIRGLPDRVEPEFRNLALANACDIYLAKGILDTAYMYARELATSPDFNNRNNGYRIMLSPELRGRIPIDSLPDLILLKCGVTPTELVKLICRSKGAISSRRERLGEKMFGTKKTVADVDAIIRRL